MIQAILLIRLKQAIRIINDLGLIRFIFISFIIGTVAFLAFMATNNNDGSIVVSFLLLVSIFSLHIKRNDSLFLKIHAEKYIQVQIIEYILISLPIIAGLAMHGEYLIILILLAAILMITLVAKPFKKKALNTFLQRFIPDHCYEMKGGVRKSFYWLLIIWLAAFTTGFWIGSIPIAIVLTGFIFLGFIDKNEPLQYILLFEKAPHTFISGKIADQLKAYTILAIPLIIVFLSFHLRFWYLAILPFLIILFLQVYAILCKYTFYVPDSRSAGQPFIMLGFISVLLPFLLPLVIVLTIRFYFRSINNLRQYLYDYH